MPSPTSPEVIRLLAGGALGQVGWLYERGASDDDIYRSLRKLYPDSPYQAVRSVADRAIDAREAGRLFEGSETGLTVTPSEFGSDPTQTDPTGESGGRFRYQGFYDFQSPRFGRPVPRPFSIYTDQQLTREEVEAKAYDIYSARLSGANYPDPVRPGEEPGRFLGTRVTLISGAY